MEKYRRTCKHACYVFMYKKTTAKCVCFYFLHLVLTFSLSPHYIIMVKDSFLPIQRAILKFAKYTGATHIAGRFTPGTYTNQITAAFQEPRLIIVSDPRTDHQVCAECVCIGQGSRLAECAAIDVGGMFKYGKFITWNCIISTGNVVLF